MPLSLDLTGQRALVTGVTSGIGAATAAILAQAGCDVAGCGLEPNDSPAARAFAAAVQAAHRRVEYRQVDVAQPKAARDWVKDAATALGGCDVLVSNAGRNLFQGVADCTDDQWDECLNLDLASHWRIAQAARPWLEHARPGVIIVVSSNHAFRTLPGCFPYNVAKAGLGALVQSMAIEWGPNVRALALAPGFIDTPGNQRWFDTFPDPAAQRRITENAHPIGRIGRPEEIGALCACLASSWGGFINGTTLIIDGGRGALLQD